MSHFVLGMYLCVLGLLAVHIQTHPHHTREQDHHCARELHYHKDHGHCELPTHSLAPSVLSLKALATAPVQQYVLLSLSTAPTDLRAEHPRFFSLRAPPALG